MTPHLIKINLQNPISEWNVIFIMSGWARHCSPLVVVHVYEDVTNHQG